jgi:hypothetical protein
MWADNNHPSPIFALIRYLLSAYADGDCGFHVIGCCYFPLYIYIYLDARGFGSSQGKRATNVM